MKPANLPGKNPPAKKENELELPAGPPPGWEEDPDRPKEEDPNDQDRGVTIIHPDGSREEDDDDKPKSRLGTTDERYIC